VFNGLFGRKGDAKVLKGSLTLRYTVYGGKVPRRGNLVGKNSAKKLTKTWREKSQDWKEKLRLGGLSI